MKDLFEALGPRIAAEHAHQRDELPRALSLGGDAAAELVALLAEEVTGRNAVVVSDVRTRAAAGQATLAALRDSGFVVDEVLLPDERGHSPRCDDVTLRAVRARLPAVDVLVGVGSGVVSDLVKWLAFEVKRPAAIVATAASMNGYAAANVAPAVDGVKTLVRARAHRVIAADPEVLAHAPPQLTSAGLGDVIAKRVSTADWRMNHLLFDEPYSDAIAGVLDGVEARYVEVPEKLAAGDHDATCALFEALVYSGCAMTLQGSSLPASGGEHLISHTLDMRADAEGSRHDLHGRQVGLGTVLAAALYERVLALDTLPLHAAPLPLDRAGWGPIADAVAAHHARQSERLRQACARLAEPGVWSELRATLAPMLPKAAFVKDVLRRAGAAHRIEDIGCDRARFRWAVLNAAQIRERFTSLDLAWAAGVLPSALDEIVDGHLS